MENKKKKLKGMSLVEIIISLAVMAIMGILLITLGTTIDSTTRATNKLKMQNSTAVALCGCSCDKCLCV